jgi:hypothetical protein
VAFFRLKNKIPKLIMKLASLDGDQKMIKNIGLLEIHGLPTGEKKDTSEWQLKMEQEFAMSR